MALADKRQAEAAMTAAKTSLDYALIRSSVPGYVGRIELRKGSRISTADPFP